MSGFGAFSIKGGRPRAGPKASPLQGAFQDSDEDAEEMPQAAAGAEELQELGNQAAAGQQWGLALRRWDEALAAHPANAHVLHEQKAQVFLEIGDAWRAIQSATAATQLQPGWPEGHLTLSRAQLNFGEVELALQSMETVLRLQPGNAEASEEIATLRMLVLQRRGAAAGGRGGGGGGGGGPGGGGAAGGGGGSRWRLRVVGPSEQPPA